MVQSFNKFHFLRIDYLYLDSFATGSLIFKKNPVQNCYFNFEPVRNLMKYVYGLFLVYPSGT